MNKRVKKERVDLLVQDPYRQRVYGENPTDALRVSYRRTINASDYLLDADYPLEHQEKFRDVDGSENSAIGNSSELRIISVIYSPQVA